MRCRTIVAGFLALAVGTGCRDEPYWVDGADQPVPRGTPGHPNVVLILADDLGSMDCGVCGSALYRTPNLDRLAERGLRFTNAYAANPLCSPTRASILTGQYPARLGLTVPGGHQREVTTQAFLPTAAPATSPRIEPVPSNRLPFDQLTLAEALHEQGLATAHLGKWHLGWSEYEPPAYGFELALPGGSYAGPPHYLSPYGIPGFADGPAGEHIDQRLAEEAVAFMRSQQGGSFFLNFWLFSVHAPFEAQAEIVQQYAARVDPDAAQRSPTMAAMIESMDTSLGRVLDVIDSLGSADNTLIVFFSDNGGNMYEEVDGTTPTSNLPLRGGKATLYEGGIRVPLIVSWPGVIEPGTVSDAMVSSVDLYPTILDLIGAPPRPDQVVDGVSFAPVIRGESAVARDSSFCHFPHTTPATAHVAGTSVRRDNYKLIRYYADNADQTDRYELYDLLDDPGENVNLADTLPLIVAELEELIDQHLQDTGALVPIANPAYVPPAAP